ncbi:hypothetical protein BJY04DRAFT_188446 [Aspergillus karnatakaensis]|uniref:uncharacterized protein n=1 Tax=Aspergillus karnatakaensis TaxID=1810916 RepID=UPI003CCDE46F
MLLTGRVTSTALTGYLICRQTVGFGLASLYATSHSVQQTARVRVVRGEGQFSQFEPVAPRTNNFLARSASTKPVDISSGREHSDETVRDFAVSNWAAFLAAPVLWSDESSLYALLGTRQNHHQSDALSHLISNKLPV